MLILVLLGMYFDAVVFVKTFLLLFRLALAILCIVMILKKGFCLISSSLLKDTVQIMLSKYP